MFQRQVNISKVLSDCVPEKAFWFVTGAITRNLHELVNTIEGLNEWSFVYHCNKDHNDFSKWIKDVFDDPYLADDLMHEYNQKRFVEKIRKRIEELERF